MVHKGKQVYLKNLRKLEAQGQVEQPKVPKKAKVIVRNLPFKNLSEKSVEEFFKEYGDIEEVKLLKKDDGKFLGCGFVQFKKVTSAAKAIRHANQKEMNGRKIVVDWALPKNTFLEKINKLGSNHSNNVKKEGSVEDENIEFVIDKKPDVWDCDKASEVDESKVKLEGENDTSENEEEENFRENSEDDESEDDVDDDDYDDDDDDDDNSYINDNDSDIINEKDQKLLKNRNNLQRTKSSVTSDDVEEGKTVFIRNIPFLATNEDLKSCLESYGPIDYALICVDKLTEHSKGTGFVKFKNKESASQCIKDSTKVYLQDNPLTITTALSKTDLESKKNLKKTAKDSRNLYLIREGTVIAGSKAAAGVSAGDMTKRLQLEQWKNQILKDLNMFVSKTRLVIHNLPPSYDDSKLRNLFTKYSNPKAVIREAKVMYDKKRLDGTGKGVSKEVGFVSFTNHEDALQALRNINNNPEIFTPKKRPIVAFSIENKAVMNSKLKRVEKSRAKLGITEDNLNKFSKLNRKQRRFLRRREKFIKMRKEAKKLKEEVSNDPSVGNDESKKIKRKNSEVFESNKKRKISHSVQNTENDVRNLFMGVVSETGKKVKLRSKFRLKNQANIHSLTLKKERKKRREKEKKMLAFDKTPKQKKQKTKLIDDANLSKLLKKHRESIQQSSVLKKWYDN